MKQYINKADMMAEIEKLREDEYLCDTFEESSGYYNALDKIATFLNTIKMKEVDLEEEFGNYIEHYRNIETGYTMFGIAEYFFELGLKANYPITASDRGMAEEIIINLKRIEKDYLIDLTKEIEWLRNKTLKGEEV